MGNFIQKIISSWSQQPTKIVMVGLDAAGKTTILYKLKLGEVITTARKSSPRHDVESTTPTKLTTLLPFFLLPSSSGPTASNHRFQRRIGHVQKIRHDRVGHWGTERQQQDAESVHSWGLGHLSLLRHHQQGELPGP